MKLFNWLKPKPKEYPVITINFSVNIEQPEVIRIIETYILPLIKVFSEKDKNIVIGGDYGLAKFIDLKRGINDIEIQFGNETTMSEFINHNLIKILKEYLKQMEVCGYNSPVVYSIGIDSDIDYPDDSHINKSIFRSILMPLFTPYYDFVTIEYLRDSNKLSKIDIHMYDGNSKFMVIFIQSEIIDKLKDIGISSHLLGIFIPQYKTSDEYLSNNIEVIKEYVNDKSVMEINAKIQ